MTNSGLSEALHRAVRTSLTFSVVLLVVNLPGITIRTGQNFLFLDLDFRALAIVKTMLAIGATWAIINLVLDWNTEANPILREERGETARVLDAVSSVSNDVMKNLGNFEGFQAKLGEQIDQLERMSATKIVASSPPPDLLDHISRRLSLKNLKISESIATKFITSIEEYFRTRGYEGEMPSHDRMAPLLGDITPLEQEITHRFMSSTSELMGTLAQPILNDISNTLRSGQESLQRVADSVRAEYSVIRESTKWLRRESVLTMLRVRGMMLVLPILTFSLAVSYWIGSMGFWIFPDLLSELHS